VATCEKIAGAAVRSTGRPRYRSENRSVIVGCRIYQRRRRRNRGEEAGECVLLEAQATIAGSQRLRGRPLGLSPVERDRPRPQRERNAPVICALVCMCVRVCSTCVCVHRSDRPPRHEGTRGTRSPTFTFTLTFTLAPGSCGCIGSRHTGLSRASGPHTPS